MLLIGSQYNKSNYSDELYIENEQILFSKEQAEQSSVISLTEGWTFVPNQLITPTELKDALTQPIEMPYINRKVSKGTYSIKLRVPEANRIYSLRFVSSSNEQSVWVNNELIDQFNISRNTDTIVFYAQETDLEIVIHSISTGNNISVVETPSFGTMKQMKNLKYIDFGFNLFIVTIFFIFGLYSLLIHLWRRSDPFFFYGGVYFILISISTLFAGEKIGMQLFPFLSDSISFKIKTVIGLSSLIPLVFLIRYLKFVDIPKQVSQQFSVFCLSLTVIMSLLPMQIYLQIEDYVWIWITFVLIVILTLLFLAMYKKKNYSSELFYTFVAFLHFAIYLILLIRKNLYDGVGIPSDKLQSILQLTDADSGIGIQNVIQRLTYMNHGDITIDSELNKGTSVTIIFPLLERETEE